LTQGKVPARASFDFKLVRDFFSFVNWTFQKGIHKDSFFEFLEIIAFVPVPLLTYKNRMYVFVNSRVG
jgi:hypothetical protein